MRRTLRRLCEAHQEPVSGDKGFMTYAQACAIFGFQMNERIEKKELKKRFNKLVLKHHPDHGGTANDFQLLREAQKIMETHRHDKGDERVQKGRGFNFKKMTYDDMTNTIHRQTVENPENRSFGSLDLLVFLGMVGFMSTAYFYYAWKTQEHLARSRWRMTEDKMSPTTNASKKGTHEWHPWTATQEQRDETYVLGVIQGSVEQEVLKQRSEEVPYVPHPLVARNPWGASSVQANRKSSAETSLTS